MRIALLQTHSKNNEDIYQMSLKNHVQYAAQHEYGMIQENISYYEALHDVVNIFSRALKIYDMILSIGSDVVFTNMAIPIESFIESGKGIAISREDIGSLCNADTIALKNSYECQSVIDYFNKTKARWENESWGIQRAFNWILQEKPDDVYEKVSFHPVRKMQSTIFSDYASKWQPGDFSLHFVGCSNDEKRQRMGMFLNEGKVWWRPGIL